MTTMSAQNTTFYNSVFLFMLLKEFFTWWFLILKVRDCFETKRLAGGNHFAVF